MSLLRKTSLKDIAEAAGVSTALVSFVLNGKEKEYRVGEKTAQRILKIANEMNYQPNLAAKSLRSGKTKTIGLVVSDISNPFFSQLARVLEDEAAAVGGGREQHAFMDNRFGGGRLVRVLADINGTAVVGKLLVRGVVVYLGDIAVYHAGRTDTGHASGSQIDTLHTPSQGYLADSLTDKQLVGFV